jgi:hypothetical protein
MVCVPQVKLFRPLLALTGLANSWQGSILRNSSRPVLTALPQQSPVRGPLDVLILEGGTRCDRDVPTSPKVVGLGGRRVLVRVQADCTIGIPVAKLCDVTDEPYRVAPACHLLYWEGELD